MEKQSFFYSNTHHSESHGLHGNQPLATEHFLGVPSSRPSGFESVTRFPGHTDFSGQSTLDMFRPGGSMSLPTRFP